MDDPPAESNTPDEGEPMQVDTEKEGEDTNDASAAEPQDAEDGQQHEDNEEEEIATAADDDEEPVVAAVAIAEDESSVVAEASTVVDEAVDDDDEEEEEEIIAATVLSTKDETAAVAARTPATKQSPAKASRNGNKKTATGACVNGLFIPFRTIKKAMKLDPDTPIVQNEAALVLTVATELFVKRLAKLSNKKMRRSLGGATKRSVMVRYEDVAEARASQANLSFLEPILP